ncbi:MAG TPA: tRNA (adenosine(37)-N6)-threonylcarbamoyltransferase complex dimerization subunit type 1 TsaB [Candidatus Enterousia intestinigallinarum]|uniref:tRNA (Adenosine(37)-N6)-threonylcarbamoyltransferase complex dimerization subunit type 1 TsaB n=1 Tax=Candidatus Enterousia intestinigallinarum TaxID=2840790 RepID=A0A9D1FFS3_9PROT|nr:tRNA (adenosine(37)-N6)-threonylcarbamoyltransferase complex dimerization subunit type 1 TsaB [Candidatus Enterousia intestinigallinarum]
MILVINTSGAGLEFVLDDKYKHIDAEKQSIALPDQAEKFLAECGAQWSDLTAIGVVVGPGSFTGIRLGIAYAKGLALGLNIPVVPVNAFEIYLRATPDAFVAIDSGRGDFFVAADGLAPCTMSIDDVEVRQMDWPRTVGHKPFDLHNAVAIVSDKLNSGNIEPVVPMYLRPSYAEQNKK